MIEYDRIDNVRLSMRLKEAINRLKESENSIYQRFHCQRPTMLLVDKAKSV